MRKGRFLCRWRHGMGSMVLATGTAVLWNPVFKQPRRVFLGSFRTVRVWEVDLGHHNDRRSAGARSASSHMPSPFCILAVGLSLSPAHAFVLQWSRGSAEQPQRRHPLMAAATCPLRDALTCPFADSASSDSASAAPPPSSSPPLRFGTVLDDVEKRVLDQAGLSQPIACAVAEASLDTVLRAATDECGSLTVSVNSSSSAGLLLRGELLSARIEATSISGAGLRASRLELSTPRIDFDLPAAQLFQQGPAAVLRAARDLVSTSASGSAASVLSNGLLRPPNLKSAAAVSFDVTLSQDNINRSPVLFQALEALLLELLESGVSAAIGEALGTRGEPGALKVQLERVEAPQGGKLVLVAGAEATQRDGVTRSLTGMRVRCTPRVASNGRLVVLDRPELVSSFEGFGAKVEVGLPFLRAAGVPLPADVALRSLIVDDGALRLRGAATIRPVDYEEIVAAAQQQATDAARGSAGSRGSAWASDAVPVDVGAGGGVVDVDARADGGGTAGAASLPPGRQ